MPAWLNRHGGKFHSIVVLPKFLPPIAFSSAPGKAVVLPIALLVPVVDVVVAEPAEEEVGERLVTGTRRVAGGAPQPDRRMLERDSQAAIERAIELWHGLAVHELAEERQAPLCPRLVVYRAKRIAHVRVVQRRVERVEASDVHWHVLILGQPVEIAGDAAADVEIEPSRFVEDERAAVSDEKLVALPAGFGRTEEIVEVGVVQRAAMPRQSYRSYAAARCTRSPDGKPVSGDYGGRRCRRFSCSGSDRLSRRPTPGDVLVALDDRIEDSRREPASEPVRARSSAASCRTESRRAIRRSTS